MYSNEHKKRRPRFSNSELSMLVNEVYANKEILFSKKCSTYSNEQKSRAWQAVTDSINTVSTVDEPRTHEEVRRKWYYYLSDKKKEFYRHKSQRKAHSSILYSPSDLKILEILGEIESEEGEVDCKVEGLVCEVDADALQIRSPAASSGNGEHRMSHDNRIFNAATASGHHSSLNTGEMKGYVGETPMYSTKNLNGATTYDDDCYPVSGFKSPGKYSRLSHDNNSIGGKADDSDDPANNSTGKRRLLLQEYQVQVLQDIYKQMQQDSERDRQFQESFLNIQRQKLELKRMALQQRNRYN